MSKSIKLFVIRKWLSNKTFHKIGCFHWLKGMGMSTGAEVMNLWCGAWRREKLVQTVAGPLDSLSGLYICHSCWGWLFDGCFSINMPRM